MDDQEPQDTSPRSTSERVALLLMALTPFVLIGLVYWALRFTAG